MAESSACANSSSAGLTVVAMLSVSDMGRPRLDARLALLEVGGYGSLCLLLLLLHA